VDFSPKEVRCKSPLFNGFFNDFDHHGTAKSVAEVPQDPPVTRKDPCPTSGYSISLEFKHGQLDE
jgi:hypothetical protein